jgi:hypothetical protein
MRLVKSTTLEKMIALTLRTTAVCAIFFLVTISCWAQDNSPYSRYGLGDLVPRTNILTRGMGSFSAGYADPFSVNFTNPASYSSFIAYREERSKKTASGRALFDVGINFDSHSLREGSSPEKFTSTNAVFSYMQVGLPLKRNWGLNFGLRQISRVGYEIIRTERLFDPVTGDPIDSAATEFTGTGGSYLASVGTGIAIKNFSAGINFGYLWGNKDFATKRAFLNDTVEYHSSNHTTKTSFGDIYLDGGVQYKIDLSHRTLLRVGAYGNLKQSLSGRQDILRETFNRTAIGDVQLDSVFEQKDIKGKVIYPSRYGVGFVIDKGPDREHNKFGGWLFGIDFIQNKWNEYRFFGAIDSVQNNWELKLGAQIRPEPKGNYFSNVVYRAGLFVGKDYVHVRDDLPLAGISFGMGLPLYNYNQLARTQVSVINIAFEYIKRGNNDNLLKENLFRISLGLSFSDLWFVKRKYE